MMDELSDPNLMKLSILHQVNTLVTPLRTIYDQDESNRMPEPIELLMGDMVMIALALTTADSEISSFELGLINEVRETIYGEIAAPLVCNTHADLYRQFLSSYPTATLTLDHLPQSIQRLQSYDVEHGTGYAEQAKDLLLSFASLIVRADGQAHPNEEIVLSNFQEVLYPSIQDKKS